MLIRRLRRSLALRGPGRTTMLAGRWLGFHLRHGLRPSPAGFDLEFGMATAASADVAGERKGGPGVEYGPVDLVHFSALLAQVEIAGGDFVFLDIGCGRGRALMLASYYPFRQIRGVEYDRDLEQSAQRHLAQWASRRRRGQRCFDLAAAWEDAAEWSFPVAPSVFYFNEPLLEPTLRRLAARIRQSLLADPRPAYVLYLGDWGAPVWEESPGFEPIYHHEDRSVYRWRSPGA